MALRAGIVGLPNVGKSTLFNALCESGVAEAANYPFCTIEPNVGVVPVPDPRLRRLAELARSERVVPTAMEFVDIAGLVAGASRGEGLGNQFLAHIREVDAIIHVVRCFLDEDVTHVAGTVDPVRDIEVIETELLLKDLETAERRLERALRAAKTGTKESKSEAAFAERVRDHLADGRTARTFETGGPEEARWLRESFLLSAKPVLYAANVGEADLPDGNAHVDAAWAAAEREGAGVVVISAEFEAQLAELESDERRAFLEAAGVEGPGLHRLVRAAYELLGLITFFTAAPNETRAWTVRRGTKAPQAAGTIHTDFEKGFIRAETIKLADYERLGSESKAREHGAMRAEGKEYVVKDADVILFRFNV